MLSEGERKGGRKDKKPSKQRSFLGELLLMAGIGFLVVMLVKGFLVQTFYIPSGSMETTLLCNDRVLVNRLAYVGGGPSRKDVIVFRNWRDPQGGTRENVEPTPFPRNIAMALREGAGFGSGGDEDLIKRVIGLPGDTVEVENSRAIVNGKALDEPYVFVDGDDGRRDFGPVTVPPGHYFVMGDHRNNSADSRQEGDGLFVDEDAIVGRAFVRFWPVSRFGGLGGPPDEPEARLCNGMTFKAD
ncbi:MAG: signal peptidase I [Acidimicrobiia bacterium]|nr:signal peptidase I [Acidimicrobiia bacterium]